MDPDDAGVPAVLPAPQPTPRAPELDALLPPEDDEETNAALQDSVIIKNALRAYHDAPQHLRRQFRGVGSSLMDDWNASEDGKRASSSSTMSYLSDLEEVKFDNLLEAGTKEEVAKKLAASIGRRSKLTESLSSDKKETFRFLWSEVLVPWMNQELLDAGAKPDWDPEWSFGGPNMLVVPHSHLLLVPTHQAPTLGTRQNATLVISRLKGVIPLVEDEKASLHDRHLDPHHYTQNRKRVIEHADTPYDVPTKFSCTLEPTYQRLWNDIIYPLRSIILSDSAIVGYGASNADFLAKWSEQQEEEGAKLLKGSETLSSRGEDAVFREANRPVSMLEFTISEVLVRKVVEGLRPAIDAYTVKHADSHTTPPTFPDSTPLTVETLVQLLLPSSTETLHYTELISLGHPSAFTISPKPISFALVQDETLNDLVREQGGVIADSLCHLYQSLNNATSQLHTTWWTEFWSVRRRLPDATLDDLRREASTRFSTVTQLLLYKYEDAMEFAILRQWNDPPVLDDDSPVLPVLLFIQRYTAVSALMVPVPFTSVLAPSVSPWSMLGDIPYQKLGTREQQQRADRFSVDSQPYSSILANSVGAWSAFGDYPTQTTHRRRNQRGVDMRTISYQPYSSRLASSVGAWSSFGDYPTQSTLQRNGQLQSDTGFAQVRPYASSAAPSVGAWDSFGDIPTQSGQQRRRQLAQDTMSVDARPFSSEAQPFVGAWDSFGDFPTQSIVAQTSQLRSDRRVVKGLESRDPRWVPYTPAGTTVKRTGVWSHFGDYATQRWNTRKAQAVHDAELARKLFGRA